ncbi:hypothetical protein OXX80_010512 [Metschnikowia pulcherrima]
MPVRLRPEKQILEDIVKYKSIVQDLGDAGDIPTRRNKSRKQIRQPKGKKRKCTTRRGTGQSAAGSKLKALENIKRKISSQKPSFMGGKAPLAGLHPGPHSSVNTRGSIDHTPKDGEETHISPKLKDSFPKVKGIDFYARSFEQKVSVQTNYNQMIKTVRENADGIDFGLSWKILPKNLGKERERFHFDHEADRIMFHQSGSILSGDIDFYFRHLGQTFSETNARNVPLV